MFASIALVLAAAPSAGVTEPTPSPPIEAFASAAMACLAATQTEETDERAIESHNWVRSAEQPYPLDRSISFIQAGSDVDLYVLKPEKQCLVLWLVNSSGDNGAFIEAVIEAVKDRTTSEFRGATHGPLQITRNASVVVFDVAGTVGDIRAEDRDATMAFAFIAMNKENRARVQPVQAVTSPQPSED